MFKDWDFRGMAAQFASDNFEWKIKRGKNERNENNLANDEWVSHCDPSFFPGILPSFREVRYSIVHDFRWDSKHYGDYLPEDWGVNWGETCKIYHFF